MKIGIIGTRGIPNYYGGFEQFAEYLSRGLVKRGHDVYVYSSSLHPYQEKSWEGVNIIHKYDPEDRLNTAGQFIYDFNCILDSRTRDYDLILQLGYTSSSVWGWLLPSKPVILTNMDGLEWKRTKYSKPVQKFLKYAEKLAVKSSDYLISDSLGIKEYLHKSYGADSTYIPYGAHAFDNPQIDILKKYKVKPYEYNMLIARMEPENNVETILQGVTYTEAKSIFLVIGNTKTKYGEYLKNRFSKYENIRFLESIFDINALNNLRYFSNIYFHGHTVGGTNPSLLEAMASSAFICAHKNKFNAAILEEDALYFENSREVASHIDNFKVKRFESINNNLDKINKLYNWDIIIEQYEALMTDKVYGKIYA